MDPTTAQSSGTSPSLTQLLGGLGSLAGAGLGVYGQSQQNSTLQNALNTIGPTQLQGYNLSGPGGLSSSYNQTGGANVSLGGLNGAFNNLSGIGTTGTSSYDPSVLSGLLSQGQGTSSSALNNLNSAYTGNNNYQAQAAGLAGSAGQTYNQVYGNTLSSLQAQQQPQVQQQAFGLQNTLFGNGVAGSTGAASGALMAGNFGSQVNAMNAQDSLSAQQQALSAQTGQTQNAATLSNTGNSLLSNAFSNFGNTNQLLSGLNTQQLTNSLSALQGAGGLNTMGLNNLQSALGVGSSQATATNQSLFPYASVATALGSSPTTASAAGSALNSLGSSLLGPAGSSSGLAGLLSQLLGGSSSSQLSQLTGAGSSILGSAANTGNLGSNQIAAPTVSTGDPGSGLDFSGGSLGADGTLSFNGAGGQATTQPTVDSSQMEQVRAGSVPGLQSDVASGLGIASGALSGTATGQTGAGLQAAQLAAKNNLLGANSGGINTAAGDSLDALGIYSGLKQGGVAGDAGAAVSAAKLGSATGVLPGVVGSVAGDIAAPLALYNFGKNWESGATGSDTLNGAEAGASIGSIVPGIGTAIGAAVGAVVGAASSAAGGGKPDQETEMQESADKAGGNALAGQSPSTSFQYLAGVMDAKNNTAGHSTDLEQAFGREGEGGVLNGMTGAVNSAVNSGQMTQNSDGSVSFKTGGGTVIYPASQAAQGVFGEIVTPYLQGKGVDPSSLSFTDAKGSSSGDNLSDSLQNLLGSWMNGSLTASTSIGVAGQKDSGLAAYAG